MSLKAKSKGVKKDIRLMPDITTPPFASSDGSSFSDNFMLVSLSERENIRNYASYFSYTSEQLQSGEVKNFPTTIDTSQPFMGYREVFPMTVSSSYAHIVVKITEFYPVLGREHYIFYNNTEWSSWKTINNT